MRSGTVDKIMVAAILIVLMIGQVWSGVDFVGIDKTCVDKNGTICNHRPPEECRFEGLDQLNERRPPATNPEELFKVTVLINYVDLSKRKRYLMLEWTQALSNQPGPVFVGVSPLVLGRVLPDNVICMSNYGQEYKMVERTSESAFEIKNRRHSTLVPWFENITSALVEIKTNTSMSDYLVQIPKYGRHYHHIVYTLTLVCYEYIKGGENQTMERRSLIVVSSSVKHTSCSSAHAEIYYTYRTAPTSPMIYEMTHWVYGLIIDAQLLGYSQNQVLAVIRLTTLLFGRSGTSAITKSTVSQKVNTGNSIRDQFINETITVAELSGVLDKDHSTRVTSSPEREDEPPSGIPVYMVPKTNTSSAELVSVGQSLAATSEKSQNDTDDIIKVVWGISTVLGVLIVVAVSFIAMRLWKNKRKQNTPPNVKYSDVKKSDNIGREHLCIIHDSQQVITFNGKSKFRYDCCSNRTSDTPSNNDVSDPLLNCCLIASQSLNHIHSPTDYFHSGSNSEGKEISQESKHNGSIQEPALNYLLAGQYAQRHFNYDILLNGRKPSKQTHPVQNSAGLERTKASEDNINLEAETDKPIPTNMFRYQDCIHRSSGYSSGKNQSCSCQNATRHWSHPVLNLTEQSILDRELSDYKLSCLIEPETIDGDLHPWTMMSECMKINQTYEALTGNDTDISHQLDDECFSISESIAC